MAVLASGLALTAWADHKVGHNPGGGKPGGGGGGGKEARYTIVDLGTFGGWGGPALSINESGQVVGKSSYADSYASRAFLVTPETDAGGNLVWFRDGDDDGINDLMIDLGTLGLGNGSYVTSVALGINDLGQVVGYSVTDDFVISGDGVTRFYLQRAFLITPETDADGNLVWFRDGGGGVNALMIDLGIIGGDWSTPSSFVKGYGISNSGHVVGYVSRMDNVSAGHAFVIAPEDTDSDGFPDTWFRDDDEDGFNDLMVDLGTLRADPTSQAWSQAWGVNDSGQVVGKSFGDYVNNERWYKDRAFLITPEDTDGDGVPETWFRDDGPGSNALMIELAPLSGTDTRCGAWAVNSLGQVIGWSTDNSGSTHAVLWEVDGQGNVTLTDLGKVKGKQLTRASGINDAGQVVGSGYSYGSGSFTAFLWENGNMTKLIDLIANSEGIGDLGAAEINEYGEIAGTIYGDGYHHAYIALPIIPSP